MSRALKVLALGLALVMMIALPVVAQGPYDLYLPYVLNQRVSDTNAVGVAQVVEGLTAPLDIKPARDGSGRLFIVEQTGIIHVMLADGTILETPFLDISDRLVSLNDNYDERGLLGLAFHPEFAANGRFYIYYSAPLRDGAPGDWNHTSHISEFMVSRENRNIADTDSEQIILAVDQPQANHDGGDIAFGPDGYLYIPLGDGGAANDVGVGHPPLGNGQDITTLLGSILRIDVDDTDGSANGAAYGIPSDNPFVGEEGRDEIWAYGFRNPYRLSFDLADDGALYVSDAGQNRWEEVDVVVRGGNYGWNIREGSHCFDPENPNTPPETCPDTGPNGEPLIDPILEYANANSPTGGLGRVVVGGHVYRGDALPAYVGDYVFGDWSDSFGAPEGQLLLGMRPGEPEEDWALRELAVTHGVTDTLHVYVRGFGRDTANEMYVLTSMQAGPTGQTGEVLKLVAPGEETPFVSVVDQDILSDTVTVAEVVSDGPGWMVIHAEAEGGGPGPVIGHSAVMDGRSLYVTVPISVSEATDTLYAMLHADLGAEGTYEFPGADVPQRVDGQVVVKPFVVREMHPAIEVMDQEIADDAVIVPEAIIEGPGWVVIHADDEGAPGPVIGHAPIGDGRTISVTVPIEVTSATQTLYGMLHHDLGDVGSYEFPGADVPVMYDGAVVVKPFEVMTTTVTPDVMVSDQQVPGTTVVVDRVVSDGPGWIVIHADDEGSPGQVLGHSAVTDGVNTDVMVDIGMNGVTDVLWAMLHADLGAVGVYEFPGADVPVQVDGQVVMASFNVLSSPTTPAVVANDQQITGTTVIVDEVVSDGPGWIVIHADDEGSPGQVLGHSAVSDGMNISVTVGIDLSGLTDTLWAMLHTDAGTVGTYEFPGADVPVQVDGQIVMAPFDLLPTTPTVIVEMRNLAFQPETVVIRAGTTVRWINREAVVHTTTSDDMLWDSGSMDLGDNYWRQFTTPGVYPYHCTFHGDAGGVGMSGMVIVFPS